MRDVAIIGGGKIGSTIADMLSAPAIIASPSPTARPSSSRDWRQTRRCRPPSWR